VSYSYFRPIHRLSYLTFCDFLQFVHTNAINPTTANSEFLFRSLQLSGDIHTRLLTALLNKLQKYIKFGSDLKESQ
jgi:hypothetical protein